MNLAPIVLFVYNRPEILQKSLESLLKNALCKDSLLYVFSDGAKNDAAVPKVSQVRQIIRQLQGFREIIITERKENQGLAQSIINGVSQVIAIHGKAIVLEDDLLYASNFLEFINDCLETYSQRKDIFAVTGFRPPIDIDIEYKFDIFLASRCSSYGWATWHDRWEKADWEVRDFQDFLHNKKMRKEFEKGGNDLTPMLIKQQKGIIDSWAIRWDYARFKNKAYSVYPVHSKVAHIGVGKDATNITNILKNPTTKVEEMPYQLQYNISYEADSTLMKNFRRYYNVSLLRKVINYFKFGIW